MANVDRVFELEAGVVTDRPLTSRDRADTENLIPGIGQDSKPRVRPGVRHYKALQSTLDEGRSVHLVDINERTKTRLVAVQDAQTGAITHLWNYTEQIGRQMPPDITAGRGGDVPLFFDKSYWRDDEKPFVAMYSSLGNQLEFHYFNMSGDGAPLAVTRLANGYVAMHSTLADESASYVDFFRVRTMRTEGAAYAEGAASANDAIIHDPYRTVELTGSAFWHLSSSSIGPWFEENADGVLYLLTSPVASNPAHLVLHKLDSRALTLIGSVELELSYTGTYSSFRMAKLDKDGYLVGVASHGLTRVMYKFDPLTGATVATLDVSSQLTSTGAKRECIIPMSSGVYALFSPDDSGLSPQKIYKVAQDLSTITEVISYAVATSPTKYHPAVELSGLDDTLYYFLWISGSPNKLRMREVTAFSTSPSDTTVIDLDEPDYTGWSTNHFPGVRSAYGMWVFGSSIMSLDDGSIKQAGTNVDFFGGELIDTSFVPNSERPLTNVSDPFFWYRYNFAGSRETL